ncbi:MAG TPA: amidase [Terriglobales bacterium]|nr:amidase [Terriglobales bacterium]
MPALPNSVSGLVLMDGLALSKAIGTKELSCREVMAGFLDQIERFNPKVNAIVSLEPREALLQQAEERDRELARGQRCGWMHGFPYAVKDLAPTRGLRTTWGSPLLDTVPGEDAIFVERLRSSGAIIIGKTNVPEFGMGSQTYNPIFGTTLNPYNLSKTAGGSSGGAAVALALRMLPVADGSDMMGSLRNPAAYNNVLALRPSYGRVPSAEIELFLGQLVPGPMARSVADLAMLLSVMAGPDARAPFSIEEDPAIFTRNLERDFRGTRVAWFGDLGGSLPMEPGIMALCRDALKALEGAGCTAEEIGLGFPPERMWEAWVTLRHWLIAGNLGALYKDPAKRAQMKPEAVWEVEGGLRLSAQDVYRASVTRSELYRAVLKLFETYEYLALPSAQVFPFDASIHWPQTINGIAMDTYHRWMEVVVLASMLGFPVVNVPVGFSRDGLPMGMQIIGRRHADFAVLQLAHGYEQSTRWLRDYPSPLLSRA